MEREREKTIERASTWTCTWEVLKISQSTSMDVDLFVSPIFWYLSLSVSAFRPCQEGYQRSMEKVHDKGVPTIEATEAAASVISANSYMYSQLSTLHRGTTTHTVRHWPGLVYTRSSEHARSYGSCLYYSCWWSSSLFSWNKKLALIEARPPKWAWFEKEITHI